MTHVLSQQNQKNKNTFQIPNSELKINIQMEQDQPQQVEGTVEDLEIDEPIKEPDQETNGASGDAAVQPNLVQNQTAPTVAEGTTLATTALGTQNPRMESNLTHQQLLLTNLFDGFSKIQPTMETIPLPKGLKTIKQMNLKEILKLVKDYLRGVQKPAIQSPHDDWHLFLVEFYQKWCCMGWSNTNDVIAALAGELDP